MKIVFDVRPGDAKVNSRYIIASGRLVLRSEYRTAALVMERRVQEACRRVRWKTTDQPVEVDVVTYWPTAAGDVDSCLKCALDSLQRGGAIANDSQILKLTARKQVDREKPRIEMVVRLLEVA